ncbi:MAG: divK [Rickettsiales bacterium]|jgi:two-component system cell cycle response regulator DivK|nr:divK [Rickettsiales bacterium]
MAKIAIVEDNELNLKLFRDLLNAEGYSIVETPDGMVAYDLIKNEKPDLILMDIQLQGRSGFEVIRDVKADESLKHIPIIAVTAFAMKDDQQRIMSSGCDAYISKPISILPFLETVRRFVKAPHDRKSRG